MWRDQSLVLSRNILPLCLVGYGKVFLVRKVDGQDSGRLFAMKVLKKHSVIRKKKVLEHTLTERSVLAAIRDFPFLVTLHYAFQTETKLHLVMGVSACMSPPSACLSDCVSCFFSGSQTMWRVASYSRTSTRLAHSLKTTPESMLLRSRWPWSICTRYPWHPHMHNRMSARL